MKLHRLVALLAVLALAVFTGTAMAGGGHGNGGGDRSGGSSGQQQSQSTDQSAQSDHQQSDHQSKQSDTSASQPATGGDNSQGVKPSNSTKHDTYAKASSDKTKQYGNGQTAGQIATKAGYGDATLHGPGNSQPHKTAACPGGHEVDVHALKHKSGKCESSSQPSSSGVAAVVKTKKPCKKGDSQQASAKDEHKSSETSGVAAVVKTKAKKPCKKHGEQAQAKTEEKTVVAQPVAAPAAPAAVVVSQPAAPAPAATPAPAAAAAPAPVATPAPAAAVASSSAVVSAPAAAPAPVAATPAAAGGVKGAVVALHPTKAKPSGGVLGATTRLGGNVAATRLPFTGLPLWIFALVAAGLIGLGLTMRRGAANRI